MEQMLHLLHRCGLPVEDVDFINCDGKTMNKLLQEEDYVAWVCDQDAYACSGQKCSTQSLLFMHENWASTSLVSKLKGLAKRRKLEDLTMDPFLTFTTESMLDHMKQLLEIPCSKLLFGGKPLEGHSIPSIYGAIKPTAIYVSLEEIVKDKNYELVTKEIFGPFQEIIGRLVNGTTYAGLRARTTGAPKNHWFGPFGDPRGAGIGTPEAIKLVWSCHREVIYDFGPVPNRWEIPPST
ncbi:hypothetical protein PIB30_053942 [Stylosanthes scabra]|uniref:Aldehyde dehydrogenase domain-containing protein n=1 Tax=Stylosanthes scabra TaxID=79078 RepID=A0ABU6TK75_9FABA|nr:hypothetical protein [Stylosanthes scabra]